MCATFHNQGKLPAALSRIEDTEAHMFVRKCLVPVAERPSAKKLLLDPFLSSNDTLSTTKFGIQKSLVNDLEMEKLHLTDGSHRTGMKITGKLNPEDDTIFLKVQITDKDGM